MEDGPHRTLCGVLRGKEMIDVLETLKTVNGQWRI